MKVKEIKVFLCGLAVNSFAYKRGDIKKEYEKIEAIITLLKQGEAYRQMWEEAKDIISGHYTNGESFRLLEQKYLKEAKQDVNSKPTL